MVVVCGEALIDVIRNESGNETSVPGGGPFNTARALGRLGMPVGFLGRLSTDPSGQMLAGLLAADGVDLRLASFGPEPTTRAIATVGAGGETSYGFEYEGTSAPNLSAEMLPVQLGHEVDAIHAGTLGLVFEPIASTLVALLRRDRAKRLVMVDTNVRAGIIDDAVYHERLLEVIAESTVVKASETDVRWLFPRLSVEEAAERMLGLGAGLAVVTLGEQGAYGAHRGIRVRVPAPQVRVVDTIGAGDAFGAGLLAWLYDHDRISSSISLDEEDLGAALGYACRVAALTCTRRGADPPWALDLVADQGR